MLDIKKLFTPHCLAQARLQIKSMKTNFEVHHNDYDTHALNFNCMDYILLALSGNGNKFSFPITKFRWIVL